MATVTEADVLERLVAPEGGGMPSETARAILELRFDDRAIDRMNRLAERNRSGDLAEAEAAEFEAYRRVGNFLNLLQAKARASLRAAAR